MVAGVAGAAPPPAEVVYPVIIGTAGLNVLLGVPVGSNFQSMGTDSLGEIIVNCRIALGAAERVAAIKGAIKREVCNVRKTATPAIVRNKVRDLFGSRTKQARDVEVVSAPSRLGRLTKRAWIDAAGNDEHD